MKHLDEVRIVDGPIRTFIKKLIGSNTTSTSTQTTNTSNTAKPPVTTNKSAPKPTVDLTPLDLQTMYNNNKAYGQNRYIDTSALRRFDNYLITKGVGLPQRKSLVQAYHQEGNKIGPHGNGAYGMLGWRGSRATPIINANEQQQFDYIYNTVIKGYDSTHWTDGGKGSGYMRGLDAYNAFINATDETTASHALNYGYIRPPLADRQFRVNNAKNIFITQ